MKKAITQYAGQVINLVPEPIRRTVNTFTGNLMTKINGIFEKKKKLPSNAVEESSPQQEVVTKKTEIKSTPNETGESSTAKEVVTNKTEIKLAENGGRVKVYKTTGNLNFDLTDKIMEKITPIIETRTKVIHAFSCVIYRGQGEIIEYSKTFKAPPGTFSSLADIKEYIRQCEQKRLDLEDAETWSKAYLPATATFNSKGVYEGRVLFTSVSTKIILSNEPLLGCGPLPKWLADKKCVYAIDKIDDNLCLWRCLVIHQRIMKGKKRPEEDTNREALKLARDFYRIPNLKREDVKPTRLVDFENIAKQFKVNIRLFEPAKESETAKESKTEEESKTAKESKTAWRLVFGKNQFKKNLPCVDIGLFVYKDHDEEQAEEYNRYSRQGHCFFIKDIELLTKTWECVGCRQRFNRHDNYNRHVTGGTCGGGKTKLICPGEKFERIMNSTEKVFYGGNKKFSYAACQWIEKQSELIGRHIHHALCGHGGEYYVYLYAGKEKNSHAREIPVDGYEPKSNTIFQYHGCKWHGCPCQKRKERNSLEEERSADQRYAKTIELEKKMKEQGFKIVSVWECEKPELKKKRFFKKFRPYPYFIVYDFEAICHKINEKQTDELEITAKHIPVSVAINDNLTKKPSFIVEEDPKELIKKFVVELLKRAREIEETVWLSNPVLGVYKKFNEDDKGDQYGGYLINEASVKLSKETAKSYVNWVKQVPVFGFNSGRYDINMIKEYFVENLTSLSDVNVAKKENSYMFLSTPNFKFLDIKNFLAPGLSYDAWCRAYGCELQKLAFPYEWFDSFEKLNHIGPVKYEEFYSSLKGGITISQEEYQNFCDEFHKRGCFTMKDWLKEYNLADVEPFIEALEKTREQYYPDEIDLLKDAVSIPGISMTYVLNKALKRKKYSEPDLFAPGEPCKCECSSDDCQKKGCEKCKEIRDNCEICTKNEAYEMLTTGMIGGPSIVFCRHAEAGVSKIRSHIYSEADAKTCRSVQGLDANSLYLFCSGQEMPCGKEKVFHCDPEEKDEIIQNVLNDKLFGFFEVDIEVTEQKRKRFSEFCPLFVISEVPEDQIPQHMKDYKINTGRKMIKNNKKLLGVMKTEKILLYSPLLKWYLNHGLQVTKIHRYISYISGRPFKWFPEEFSSARREADNDKNKKQLGDTAKLKGNSFYGKMIENLEKHISTKFTTDEKLIDKIFRSPFFEDLEEINEGVFEVRQRKKQVTITRPYQCGIAVYQLAKLRMLEFYYHFLDKFCDRRDFELIQMDTDSFYMALSANDFDEIIKPEMKELYFGDGAQPGSEAEKKNWLVTDEYSKRVPGLFKAEFQGKRMIALTSKCYFADNGKDEGVKKFSCKGVSRRQNKMNWERYKNALFGSLDKARNIGFRKRDNHIVTYEQTKLGLSAYYDKRIVHEDGTHTSCL